MIKLSATYRMSKSNTPAVASALITRASAFVSVIEIELEGTRIVLGSLIGVLALKLKYDATVNIIATGHDEEDAALSIKEMIEQPM